VAAAAAADSDGNASSSRLGLACGGKGRRPESAATAAATSGRWLP
jgi:hypothetical protein